MFQPDHPDDDQATGNPVYPTVEQKPANGPDEHVAQVPGVWSEPILRKLIERQYFVAGKNVGSAEANGRHFH